MVARTILEDDTMSDKENMSFVRCNHLANMDVFDVNDSNERPTTYSQWKEECYQFAQETTLHGLKYISMRDTFVLRRLFWLLLTCFCCGIMSYQIIDRIIYYYDSPITVNVKVNYNRSLTFPSVTVCNQNAFRATAAAENNWYRLIETLYNESTVPYDDKQLQHFNVTNLRLSDLFTKAGHRREDMIAGCWWAGGICSYEDFQPILTDHGLCYTFKPRNASSNILVSSTGADQGLKLFLNVEQYEYMLGPNDAAGIKLLTYDKSDIPRMKELGISIPTGIHAFVGLQMLVIKNLRIPYGECQDHQLQYSNQYSTDACVIECLNKLTENQCGCRNYFIPFNEQAGQECTIEEYYSCYKNTYKTFQDTYQDRCHCPTACHYTVFDPVVSYASTSEYSAESKLSTVSTELLKQKVLNSREVANRMEKRKVDKFMKIVKDLDDSFEDINKKFSEVKKKISTYLNFVDTRYLTDKEAWGTKTRLYKYQIYHVKKNFIRPRDAMEERTLSNLCVGFHEFVFMIERNLKHLSSHDWLDPAMRATIFTITHDAILSQIETANRALDNVTELYNAYQNGTPIFRYKFQKIPRKHNDYITPKKLLAESLVHNFYAKRYSIRLTSDINKIKESLQEFIEVLITVNFTQTFNESAFTAVKIKYIDKCEDFYHSKSVFYMECVERPVVILEKRLEMFQNNISDYMATREFIMNNIENLRDSINNISQFELLYIKSFLGYLNDYPKPNSTITKDGLSEYVLSDILLKQISRIEAIFQEIRNRGQNIFDGMTALTSRVINIWHDIVFDEDMEEYYLHRSYESFLLNWTDFHNTTNIEIMEARNTNSLRPIIGNIDKTMYNHFEVLRNHMKDFKASTKIDGNFLRENFLQVDVFYRELSYEEIEQQEAYDIFALLCDIGGSMGLFIGASVMTIFEIADFLLDVSAKNALQKRRRRKRR